MRIGLLRHFPVCLPFPAGWWTAAELQTWMAEYDTAGTEAIPADLGGIVWQACLCSDLPRARVTAAALFPGAIEETVLLREARLGALATGHLRLPVWLWGWVVRLAWMMGHSCQRACRDAFLGQIRAVADRLETMEVDTLVVSHGGVMVYLSAELRRRGYSGPKLGIPPHARVEVYERR